MAVSTTPNSKVYSPATAERCPSAPEKKSAGGAERRKSATGGRKEEEIESKLTFAFARVRWVGFVIWGNTYASSL